MKRTRLFHSVCWHIFGALPLAALLIGTANAQHYGMAGCGLGSLVFDPHSGQVSAATTNGSFMSQGFGITSGTSNCLTPGQAAAQSAQEQFIAANYSTLAKEIAQGSGDTLVAFSSTFGCHNEALPVFNETLQKAHERIFSAPGAMASLRVVKQEIQGQAMLNSACSQII